MRAVLAGKATPDVADLAATLADFIPASSPAEIELQNLVAVLECTSRALLPEAYKNAERSELIRRVNELKLMLG